MLGVVVVEVVDVETVVIVVVALMVLRLILLVSIGQQIFGTSLANPHVESCKNFIFSFVIGFSQKSPNKLIKVKSLICSPGADIRSSLWRGGNSLHSLNLNISL